MRKYLILLMVAFSVMSCSQENELNDESNKIPVENQSKVNNVREKIKNTTLEIYQQAWDGKTINIAKSEFIVQKNLDLTSADFCLTKSSVLSAEDVFKTLNENQLTIIDLMKEMIAKEDINFERLREMTSHLPSADQDYLFATIDTVEGIILGIGDVQANMLITRGIRFNLFMCNVVSGGIGSIYGAWAGALLGGPVGMGVAIVSSALISTYFC